MRNRTVSFAAFLVFCAASAVSAQQPGARVPATLTLQDALRIATENSPDYRKTQNDLDVASSEVRTGWATFLPSLNAGLSSSGSKSTTYQGQDAFSNTSSSSGQSIGANVVLFNPGQTFNRLGVARANERRTEAAVHLQTTTILANVSRSYYAARQREMLADVERRNLADARDRLNRAEQLFRLAANTHVDLLGAQQDVITAERALADAESESRKALLALQESMGVEGEYEFELSGDLPGTFDPSLLNADQLVQQALRGSPQVLQAEATHSAARTQASSARFGRWPTLGAGFSFGRSDGQQGLGGIGNLNPQNRSLSFSISASIPLFSRFQTSHQIATAEAAADDASEDVRKARLVAERDVRSALVDLEKAYRGVVAAEQIAELAGQRLEIAEERYRTGAADMDFIRLQQIVQQDEQARRGVVDARFTFLNALVALEEKLGAPVQR